MFSFKSSPKRLKKKNVVPAGSEITFSNTSGSVFPVYAHEFLQIGAKWHQPPARPPRSHEPSVQNKAPSVGERVIQTLPAHPKIHLQEYQDFRSLPSSGREQRSARTAPEPLRYNIHKELPPVLGDNSHARVVTESTAVSDWDISLSNGPAALRRVPAKREIQFQTLRNRAGAARAHDRYNSIEASLSPPIPLKVSKKHQQAVPVPSRGNTPVSQTTMPVKVAIPKEPKRTLGKHAYLSRISPIDVPRAVGMSPVDSLILSPDEIARLSPKSSYTFDDAEADRMEYLMKSAPALVPRTRPTVYDQERFLPKAAPKPQVIEPPNIQDPLARLRDMRLSAEAAKFEAERERGLRRKEKGALPLSGSRLRTEPRPPPKSAGTHRAGSNVARMTPQGVRDKAQHVTDHRRPWA